MYNKTLVSFFSGGGGFDIGAIMAGFEPIGAYEYIPEIAEYYKKNIGDHVNVISVLDVIISSILSAMLYHFSPPCPNFSNAKKGAKETDKDISFAQFICDVVTAKLPLFVTLENVYGYRKSKSFKMIVESLENSGYRVKWWHLNSANYGVPQTRKRLILIARRDGKTPRKPKQTHQKSEVGLKVKHKGMMKLDLFSLKKWIGWYEAIEDLIPDLEGSEFAPWQIKFLPDWFKYRQMAFVASGTLNNRGKDMTVRSNDAPLFTVTSTIYKRPIRAFVPHNQAASSTDGVTNEQPMYTITAGKPPSRALLLPGGNASSARAIEENEPAPTVGDTKRVGHIPKAFVMNAANPNGNEKRKFRNEDEPVKTITAGDSTGIKAFVTAPIPLGRVVKLSTRCIARLQSFPDSYILPDKKTLACTIIGNSVPPLLSKSICDTLI